MRRSIIILVVFSACWIFCYGCGKGHTNDSGGGISSVKRMEYPAEVQIKVKGIVPCYNNLRNDCLVLQQFFKQEDGSLTGYSWEGYPYQIEGFSYQSGEYTLWVLAEEETDQQGEPYLTYKYLRTLEEKPYREAKENNCEKQADKGSCEAAEPRAYFDSKEKICKLFYYGGCGGFIPFDSVEECRLYCE